MDWNELPDTVDDCLPLYHRVWERFGDGQFTVGALGDWLEATEGDGGAPGTRDLEERLHWLVAFGLLRHVDGNRFAVRCKPGESAAEWHARLEPRTEALHRRVHGAGQYGDAMDAGETSGGTIRYEGRTYRGVPVDESTGIRALHATLTGMLADASAEYDGVVLRAPATEAGTVQGLADDLYDAEDATDDAGGRRFEKVDSVVVGEDKDALEYRLFLAPEHL